MSGLALGRTVERVAEVTGKTPSTVRQQVRTAKARLGVQTRAEAILRVRQGWPRPDPRTRGKHEASLSPTMKAYAAAFDRLLLNWRDEQAASRARAEMRHLLAAEATRQDATIVRDKKHKQNRGALKDGGLHLYLLPGLEE